MKSIQGILAAIMASSAAASVYEPIALPSATADERELAEYERQPDSHSGESYYSNRFGKAGKGGGAKGGKRGSNTGKSGKGKAGKSSSNPTPKPGPGTPPATPTPGTPLPTQTPGTPLPTSPPTTTTPLPTSAPITPLPTQTAPTSLPTSLPTQTPGFKTLQILNKIKGTQTVAGIHNRVNTEVDWDEFKQFKPTGPSVFTNYTEAITGKFPGLWSGDFLFDWPNNSLAGRKRLIAEALKQYRDGALVNIMYHACNPRLKTREEKNATSPEFGRILDANCDWDDRTNGPRSKLELPEWNDLITDGGGLNTNWKGRLDLIAQDLQVLKDENVEVMFRPLHEMNQGDFWWGGRPGQDGTRRLYQITHDYLTIDKGLTNLIWVWNLIDLGGDLSVIVSKDEDNGYNPGERADGKPYWDVATLNQYGSFKKENYGVMVELQRSSGGKPIGIGECSVLPSVEILTEQPNWSFFMSWSEETFIDQGRGTNKNDDIIAVYNSDKVITLDEMLGWK